MPSKRHLPTPGKIASLEGIGVRIAGRGRIKVVGVPVGTDEYVMESAMEILRSTPGEWNNSLEMLSRMLDKQPANLIATGSILQRIAYIERVMDPDLFLPA